MSIDFTPDAVNDIDTAAVYLEAEKKGGGQRFRDDLDSLLDRLLRLPHSAALYEPPRPNHPGLRVAQLSKFSRYAVYYRPMPVGIIVVRCLDTTRNVEALMGSG